RRLLRRLLGRPGLRRLLGRRLLDRRLLGRRLLGRSLLPAPLRRTGVAADLEQLGRPLDGDPLDGFALSQRRVRLPVGDVGTEAPVLHHLRLARDRVVAQLLERRGRRGATTAERLGLGEDLHGLLEGDREELLLAVEAAGLVLPAEVGAVAAVLGDDLAALGVLPDDAGQRQQLERLLQRDRAQRHRLE